MNFGRGQRDARLSADRDRRLVHAGPPDHRARLRRRRAHGRADRGPAARRDPGHLHRHTGRGLRRAHPGRAARDRALRPDDVDLGAPAAPDARRRATASPTRPLRRPGQRHGPDPLRQRPERQVGFTAERVDQRGRSNDGHRPHRRPRQALRDHGRRRRHRPRPRGGRDLRPGRPNGAGKSTTLGSSPRCCEPSAGRRRDRRLVRDAEPRPGPARPRVHAGRLRGLRRHEGLGVPGLLRAMLRAVGRRPTADRSATCSNWSTSPTGATTYVQALSRGMQQRLCLAHALVHDPQVLLLDEPASGLDPRARVELRELLRELRVAGQDDPHQQPHPARARGAVHERGDRRSRPGPGPGPDRATSSGGSGSGPSCASGCCSRARTWRRPGQRSPPTRTSRRRRSCTTAPSSSGSAATTPRSARLLAAFGRTPACRS